MARGVNSFHGIGNMGSDPDVRFLPSGEPVANIDIAISDSWNDKATGQKKESTEWVSCVAFRQLADVIKNYAKKGDKVYVEGKMKTRKYQAKDGTDRYKTEIVLNQFQLLGGRGENGGDQRAQSQAQSYGNTAPRQPAAQQQQQQGYQPQQPQQPQQQQQQGYQPQQQSAYAQQSGGMPNAHQQAPNPNDFNDEIPF